MSSEFFQAVVSLPLVLFLLYSAARYFAQREKPVKVDTKEKERVYYGPQ